MRLILAQGTVLALLAPLLSLALSCQMTAVSGKDAMACCRTMHSACMQGEQAGSMACCHRVQPKSPAVLAAAATEAAAAAPVAIAWLQTQPQLSSRPVSSDSAPSPPGPLTILATVLRV